MIRITRTLSIPENELTFKASRSSGPGGQNVNKVNTRITLLFDLNTSPSLSSRQKRRIGSKLATRIDKSGILHVVSQKFRTQQANREAATEKFATLLREALRRKPVRKKTKVPRAAKERRIREKKRRGQLKRQRAQKHSAEDF